MIAIIMFLGACSNEAIFNDNDAINSPNTGRTLSLTATMPGHDLTTRTVLTQDENMAINITWEDGDQLQLVFVQGDIKVKKTVTVKNISEGGVRAKFDILLPPEITGTFDLFGVYGGGGLSEDNLTMVILPTNPADAGSLASLQSRKDVMLYFANKGIELTNSDVFVEFEQLGSLFCITLKNTGVPELGGITEARLVGVGGDGKWAYNIGDGGLKYDLVSGEFQNIGSAGNFISLKAGESSVAGGESITFWGWYPPLPGVLWPKLKMELRKADGTGLIKSSSNTRLARTVDTDAGKVYYFNAEWDSFYLTFTNYTPGKVIIYEENLDAIADRGNYGESYWGKWFDDAHKPVGVVNVVTEGDVATFEPYTRLNATDGGIIEAGVYTYHPKGRRGTAWFILPSVSLDLFSDAVLSFDLGVGPTNKVDPENFDIFVSTDFDGDPDNILTATWNKHTDQLKNFLGAKYIDGAVPARRHTYPLRKYVEKMFLDLSAYVGQDKVYVGFRNTSMDAGITIESQSFYVIGAPIKIEGTQE